MYSSSRGTVAAVDQRILWNRLYHDGTRRPVMMHSGWTGTRDYMADDIAGLDYTGKEQVGGITNAGFPVGSGDTLSYWGNSTFRGHLTQMKANMQAELAAPGKIHLYGVSAGGISSLLWAKYNPTLVQSMCLMITPPDLQWLYDTDPLGVGIPASIATAYGGRPGDGDNPFKNASVYASAGFPILMYYSSNDVFCTAAKVQAFQAAIGPTCTIVDQGSPSTGLPAGHVLAKPSTSGTTNAWDPRIAADWFKTYD